MFISLVSYADDSVDLVFCDNWQEEDTSKGRKGMQTRGKTIRGCENGKASCTGHSDKDNKRQSESVELQAIVVEKSASKSPTETTQSAASSSNTQERPKSIGAAKV